MPARLLAAVREEKLLTDRGTARIEQIAFAEFVTGGHLDRHLRRMRLRYGRRREALVAALAEALPEATVRGIAAGLHLTVELHRATTSGRSAPRRSTAGSPSARCPTTASGQGRRR